MKLRYPTNNLQIRKALNHYPYFNFEVNLNIIVVGKPKELK